MAWAAGEDRSSFQRVSPWTRDAFGICKATEGTGWTDPTFAENWAALKAEGKPRGAYHFFHPALSASAQAAFFVNYVKAHGGFGPGDFFVADVEILVGADGREEPGTAGVAGRMHTELAVAPSPLTSVGPAALEFLGAVAALVGPHCRVVLYTDLSMAQADLTMCAAYPLAIAYYAGSPPASVHPWGGWTFWQTGGTGPGGGDFDYFLGDEASLLAWLNPGHPAPVPSLKEENMFVLNPAGLPATVLFVPGGSTKLLLGADPGWQNQVPPSVRVGLGPAWSSQDVSPAWEDEVTVPIPAGVTRVTLARLDAGPVPVTAAFA